MKGLAMVTAKKKTDDGLTPAVCLVDSSIGRIGDVVELGATDLAQAIEFGMVDVSPAALAAAKAAK